MTFENDRGLILEELKMCSVIEESMEDMAEKGDEGTKRVHSSFLSNTVNRNTETHTVTTKIIESKESRNDKKKNLKEIEMLEN